MDIFNRYILKLKVNLLQNCGLYGNLVLHELFIRNDVCESRLVQGYIAVGDETCWHVWVEVGDAKYDVISKISDTEFTYLYERPESGAEEDDEVTAEYELYKTNKVDFWSKRSTPQRIKNFRSKMLKEKWKKS